MSENRPVRYELIDKDGSRVDEFSSAEAAALFAKIKWPRQKRDPDRTGKGWDVQVVR